MLNYSVIALCGICAASAASATSLTFDIPGLLSGNAMPQVYGDRVTSETEDATNLGTYVIGTEGATPNVVVEYLAEDARFWATGFSGLSHVYYSEPSSADFLGIRFTADPGFLVTLLGFDIGNYNNATTINEVSVTADKVTTSLASNLALPDWTNPPTNYVTNFTGEIVTLMLDFESAGNNGHDIGLSNVVFSQSAVGPAPVPVPAAMPLLAAGLGAFAWMKRRKRV